MEFNVGDKVVRIPSPLHSHFKLVCEGYGINPLSVFTVREVTGNGDSIAFEGLESKYTGIFSTENFINITKLNLRHNPQAIKAADKLANGIFRVGGMFEGKARVCEIRGVDDTLIFRPVNTSLGWKKVSKEMVNFELITGKLNIMCIERF